MLIKAYGIEFSRFWKISILGPNFQKQQGVPLVNLSFSLQNMAGLKLAAKMAFDLNIEILKYQVSQIKINFLSIVFSILLRKFL